MMEAHGPRCPACGGLHHRPSWAGSGRFEGLAYDYLECTTCRSVFVHPMPGPAELARMYSPAYLAEHYEASAEDAFNELDAELAAAAKKARALKPGGRLLDIGCGAGRFLEAARAEGLNAEGFELVDETAARTAARTGFRVHSGALAKLPSSSYDVVHLADVLEHLTAPLDTLREASRILRKDGVVIARGPLEAQPHLFLLAVRLQRRVRNRLRRAPVAIPPWHVIQFSLRGWRAVFEAACFEIREEVVGEIRWPAPQMPDRSMRSRLKSLSRAVSRSPLGERFNLGNRVTTIAGLAPAHRTCAA